MFSFYMSQFMDSASTYIGLTSSKFIEYNPFIRTLLVKYGMAETIVIKLSVAGILLAVYALAIKKNHRTVRQMELALQISGVGTFGIVLWNFILLTTHH